MTENNPDHPLSRPKETLPDPTGNRVLVLGSRMTGGDKLAQSFQEFLEKQGVPKPSVRILFDAGQIRRAVLGRETVEEGLKHPNPPKGIILLDKMRQYDDLGQGMTLDTYEVGIDTFVETLCREFGIPLIEIRKYNSPRQITDGLNLIFNDEKAGR